MIATPVRWGLMAATIVFLAGCGGGGGSSSPLVGSGGSSGTQAAVNVGATWQSVIDQGLSPVTISSPPEVRFAVLDTAGKHVAGLKLAADAACGSNVRFAIAKFDGTHWQSLISAAGAAVLDPLAGATLTEQAGHYTYKFSTEVAAQTNTVYRIGLRLCYVDPTSGATTKANPYFDFRLVDNGVGATPRYTTDIANLPTAREVVDTASCNSCHQTLAARHDDAFVDANMCVICHNPASTDATTGNSLDLRQMAHRIHMGKRLTGDYRLKTLVVRAGGGASGIDYPQDPRNCVKCHDSSLAKDAENWKAVAGRVACGGCHDGINFSTGLGTRLNGQAGHGGGAHLTDQFCSFCHTADLVSAKHAIAEWTQAAAYGYQIHSVTLKADRTVDVEFSVTNPADGSAYDVRTAPFANLSLLVGWGAGDFTNAGSGNAWGQPLAIAAPGATLLAGNHFLATSSPLPLGATGTGVVALKGSVSLTKTDGTPYTVPVKDAVDHFAIAGVKTPRRAVVSADKCNACHGRNIAAHGHNGASTEPETCVICHNGNISGDADFKRLIHTRHKAVAADGDFPVMPSTLRVVTANGDSCAAHPTAPSCVENSAKGTYAGQTGIKNCNLCHVNDSYKQNVSVLGSSVAAVADLGDNSAVISPKAAACASCHDDSDAKAHMRDVGGGGFVDVTRADVAAGRVTETCDSCHASGVPAGVDVKHGLK